MTRGDRYREMGALLRLGAPIMLAQVFQIGMQVVDTVMAGRYAPTDLAGIALASSVVMPLHVLTMGILHAVTPIVAQLHGAGREAAIGAVVRQGMWLAAGLSVLIMLVLAQGGWVLQWFDVAPPAAAVATGYMRAILWGSPGLALFLVLSRTCEGLGNTRPPMIIAGVLLAANVPLDYAFIYGKFGAPELGGVGCGVATAMLRWLQCAAILLVITRPFYAHIRLFRGGWRPDLTEIRHVTRIGVPIGLKIFGVVSLFALATLLIARFGENAVATGAVGGNVTTLIFMIPTGLGMAATIRVGHAVGAKDHAHAVTVGRTAITLSIGYGTIMAGTLILCRAWIAALYTQAPELVASIAKLLLIVAAYQFMDCTQEAVLGTLRGYKDTRIPMVYGLCGYWLVGFPVALGCGYGWFGFRPLSVYGFWMGFAAGEAFVAVSLLARWFRLRTDHVRISQLATGEAPA